MGLIDCDLAMKLNTLISSFSDKETSMKNMIGTLSIRIIGKVCCKYDETIETLLSNNILNNLEKFINWNHFHLEIELCWTLSNLATSTNPLVILNHPICSSIKNLIKKSENIEAQVFILWF